MRVAKIKVTESESVFLAFVSVFAQLCGAHVSCRRACVRL